MKKKVQHLEQLFDYAASRLTVYKGSDGRLMVTEVLGQGGYGRIYSIENLFKYAEYGHKEFEEKNFQDDLRKEFQKEIEKLRYELNQERSYIKNLLNLADRTPRFGWSK